LSSVTYLGSSDCGPSSEAFSECPLLEYVCVIDGYRDSTFCGVTVQQNCKHSSGSNSSWQSSSGEKPNPGPGNPSPSSSSFTGPSITLLGVIILATYQMFSF